MRTISNSGMICAGLKKCAPMTLSWDLVFEPMSSMSMVEVLVDSMQSGPHTLSRSAPTLQLSLRSCHKCNAHQASLCCVDLTHAISRSVEAYATICMEHTTVYSVIRGSTASKPLHMRCCMAMWMGKGCPGKVMLALHHAYLQKSSV